MLPNDKGLSTQWNQIIWIANPHPHDIPLQNLKFPVNGNIMQNAPKLTYLMPYWSTSNGTWDHSHSQWQRGSWGLPVSCREKEWCNSPAVLPHWDTLWLYYIPQVTRLHSPPALKKNNCHLWKLVGTHWQVDLNGGFPDWVGSLGRNKGKGSAPFLS